MAQKPLYGSAMRENVRVTRRALLIGVAALLFTACSPAPSTGDDEAVASADALVGRWKAIGSSETRVFTGAGTTWIEGGADDSSQKRGTYRLLSPGQLEIQIDGTAQAWTVTFGHVAGKVLKLRDAGGQISGYVDAATIPAYAPTTTTGK
jgi:hypothetical protein